MRAAPRRAAAGPPAATHAAHGCRDARRRGNVKHRIARKGIESKERLGKRRWIEERTFAWLARNRRLTIRYEHLAAMDRAFLYLGCALICFNYLQRF